MKWKQYIAAVAALLLLMACSKSKDSDDPNPPTPTPSQTAVSVYASLEPFNSYTPFDAPYQSGDEISVFAITEAQNGSLYNRGNYADNARYKFQNNQFAAVGNGIKKDSKTLLGYYGISPYSTQNCNEMTFSVQTDQSTFEGYKASDLRTAYIAPTSNNSLTFQFFHSLCQVCVNIVSDKVKASDVRLELDLKSQANVNVTADTYPATGRSTTIKMYYDNSTRCHFAIVPPQTMSKTEPFMYIIYNSIEYVVEFTDDTQFASGAQHQIDVGFEPDNEGNYHFVVIKGQINPWNTTDERLNNVVPEEIQEKMKDYMPIYTGVNPPNVEGVYFMDPCETVYCEDAGNGGYETGQVISSAYIQFMNQNFTDNTLDYKDMEPGFSVKTGKGAFISGSGNHFTAFFNTTGTSHDIPIKTALLVSGTKTSSGISDLYYAFVMVEKGSDPDNELMEEGVFRVFKDQDGLAVNSTWPSEVPSRRSASNKNSMYSTWRPFNNQK